MNRAEQHRADLCIHWGVDHIPYWLFVRIVDAKGNIRTGIYSKMPNRVDDVDTADRSRGHTLGGQWSSKRPANERAHSRHAAMMAIRADPMVVVDHYGKDARGLLMEVRGMMRALWLHVIQEGGDPFALRDTLYHPLSTAPYLHWAAELRDPVNMISMLRALRASVWRLAELGTVTRKTGPFIALVEAELERIHDRL